MSNNRVIDKEDVVYIYIYIYTHTHNGILFSHKKEWNNAICRDYTKSDREKTNIWYHLYVESKKNDTDNPCITLCMDFTHNA